MSRDERSGLEALLRRLNRGRAAERLVERLETDVERRFAASQRLAVYGSLAPGEANHQVVAPLGGDWAEGFVRGELLPAGWGSSLGFPALRWNPGGDRVAVQLLSSPALPAAWPRLDAFEGGDYVRILVPVDGAGGELLTVANLYAAR